MKLRNKIILAVISAVILIVGIFTANYILSVSRYQKQVSSMTYANIDASHIPDGSYLGECDVKFIRAKVEVTVTDGLITNILLLEHYNGKGAAAEGIEHTIINEQRIDVDAVSGATNSSIVIKKAVDNALSNATAFEKD